MKKIILTCIVRDESKIIERMLDSCRDFVDVICICDTGSVDNTLEVIENYKVKQNANIKVFNHDWVNFGHNRTLSFQVAKAHAIESSFDLNNSYVLFLDADMVLKYENFEKENLNNLCYYIKQKQGNLEYYNVRLASLSQDWECKGKTHEVWRFENMSSNNCSYLEDNIHIDDINDGGHKDSKFERDETFLTEEIEENPDNTRSHFYLARTLRSLGKTEEAIDQYLKHINHKDSQNQESYISCKDLLDIYLKKEDIGNAFKFFYMCDNFSPERTEHYYLIARYFRYQSKHNISKIFLKSCPDFKEGNFLFLEATMKYYIPFEKSISYFYTGDNKEALENSDYCYLFFPEIRSDSSQNLQFYLKPLEYLYGFKELDFQIDDNYYNSNCFLRKKGHGYKGYLKSSNYQVSETESDTIFTTTNGTPVHTKIYSIILDSNFEVKKQSLVHYNETFCQSIKGIEDCRETERGTVIGVRHDSSCSPKMVTFNVENDEAIQNLKQMPNHQTNEKNWVPLDNNIDALSKECFVYSISPFKVVDENGEIIVIKENSLHEEIRCSSNFIKLSIGGELGYLALTHEVVFLDANKRQYLFRFVFIDKDFNLKKISIPFLIEDAKIQFNMCLIKNDENPFNENDFLIIPYSINENKTKITKITIQDLNKTWNTLIT